MTFSIQPNLFEWLMPNPSAADEIRRKGSSVIRKARRLQSDLRGAEAAYSIFFDDLCAKVRSVSKLSDYQRERLVLIAIEQCGASSVAEIVEDTRIDKGSVSKIIVELGRQGILYRAKKRGSDSGGKPVWIIKSRRVKSPEAD